METFAWIQAALAGPFPSVIPAVRGQPVGASRGSLCVFGQPLSGEQGGDPVQVEQSARVAVIPRSWPSQHGCLEASALLSRFCKIWSGVKRPLPAASHMIIAATLLWGKTAQFLKS